jgi:penicillin amidase
MRITSNSRPFDIAGATLDIGRTSGGVIEICGRDQLDLMRGLGFVHAHDRLTQMSLVRLVGQGRLCECLDDSEESLAIDVFMRQLGFVHLARDEAGRCTPEAASFAEAYAEGVNAGLRRHSRPWGLKLAGLRPEPWELADTLLTILLMSYVGLAQTQQDLEKFLIQSLQAGVDRDRLKQLFAPHLDGLTDELAELTKKVRVVDPVIARFPAILPAFTASNNWAVAPWKSATGSALECHDPHLECNRLPAVWCEVVLHTPDDYQIGVTMPGVPGLIMGRTRDVSVGFTYGFMDMVDYFIEECEAGNYRRESGWLPFHVRRETIRRKKHPALTIAVYENELGTLETDPRQTKPPEGHYLCRAFSAMRGGSARSLHALSQWPRARSAEEAQCVLRDVSISCNWVLADRAGNIGYQQSGLLPDRPHSGLYPLPAWDAKAVWRGIVPVEQLASLLNPPEGFIVTANDDCNQPGKPLSINACQGPYRAERIRELLAAKDKLTIADMQAIQADLFSTQARRFMEQIRPLVPPTEGGKDFLKWTLHYSGDLEETMWDRQASWFEEFYRRLLRDVFGGGFFGTAAWDALVGSTNLIDVYFHYFDAILLGGRKGHENRWFGQRTRENAMRPILENVLHDSGMPVRGWIEKRQVTMQNLLLAGKLPRWLNRLLKVDYGPITLSGNRSTVVQGAIFKSHGRVSTFAPSYRAITDMGTDEVLTALAGGPSERVLSPLYTADIRRWLAFEYKTLRGIASLPVGVR